MYLYIKASKYYGKRWKRVEHIRNYIHSNRYYLYSQSHIQKINTMSRYRNYLDLKQHLDTSFSTVEVASTLLEWSKKKTWLHDTFISYLGDTEVFQWNARKLISKVEKNADFLGKYIVDQQLRSSLASDWYSKLSFNAQMTSKMLLIEFFKSIKEKSS